MAWALQPVVNVGLQILFSIALGWLLVRLHVLDAEKYMPQVNTLVLWVGVTCLSGYNLGLKLQLDDTEAWRQLAAYILWIAVIKLLILGYCCLERRRRRRRRSGRSSSSGRMTPRGRGAADAKGVAVIDSASSGAGAGGDLNCNGSSNGIGGTAANGGGTDGGGGTGGSGGGDGDGGDDGGDLLREFALLTLVLTANNNGMIGLPIMDATFGDPGRRLALLTGIPVMMWLIPFAIFAFEMHKVRREASEQRSTTVPQRQQGQRKSRPWDRLPYSGAPAPLRKAYSALPTSSGGGGAAASALPQRPWKGGGEAAAAVLRRHHVATDAAAAGDAADVLLTASPRRSGDAAGGGGDDGNRGSGCDGGGSSSVITVVRDINRSTDQDGTGRLASTAPLVLGRKGRPSLECAASGTARYSRDGGSSSHGGAVSAAARTAVKESLPRASQLEGPDAPADLALPGCILVGAARAAAGVVAAAAATPATPAPLVSPFAAFAGGGDASSDAYSIGGGDGGRVPQVSTPSAFATVSLSAGIVPAVAAPRRSGSTRIGGGSAAPLLATVPSGDIEPQQQQQPRPSKGLTSPAAPLPAALSLLSAASAALFGTEGRGACADGSDSIVGAAESPVTPASPVSRRTSQQPRISLAGGGSGGGGGGGSDTKGYSPTAPPSPPPGRLSVEWPTRQPTAPKSSPPPQLPDAQRRSDQFQNPQARGSSSPDDPAITAGGAAAAMVTRLETRPSSTSLSAVDLPIPHRWLLGQEEEGLPPATAGGAAAAAAARQGWGVGPGSGGGDSGEAAAAAPAAADSAPTALGQLRVVMWTVAKNPLLWSLLLSLVVNLSGLRKYLDPGSSSFVVELGFIPELLHWFASVAIPVSLVSIGVWMYGKRMPAPLLKQAGTLLLLKVAALPLLQAACALAVGLPAGPTITLVLLALCPTATTSFVIAAHFGYGTDLVSAVTLGGTVLLVPAILVALQLPRALGVELKLVSDSAAAAAAALGGGGE